MQAVKKAPKTIPGTKPAAKDFPEKESDDEAFPVAVSCVSAASVALEVVAVALLVGVGVALVDDDVVLNAASALVCATHTFEPLQVYPIGQHAVPHVSNTAVGLEWS